MKKLFTTILFIGLALSNVCAQQQDNFVTHCKVTTYNGNDSAKTKDGTVVDNKKIKQGQQRIVAISRDLLWAIPLGSIIEIEGHGRYEVRDTTGPRSKHTVDILIHKGAEHFKKDKIKIKVIQKGTQKS